MLILVKYESGEMSMVNVNECLMLNTDRTNQAITATNNNRIAFSTVYDGEDYKERFIDIVSAANADVKVYNTSKEIGYWKHTSTAHKKPAPKKEE